MSGFFQNLLSDAAKGFFGTTYLRDYQHASKTFKTNGYAYAPKLKFLFHVYFEINEQYISATKDWGQDHNFGLLVKSIQLPKYSFDLATLNQYNRKRVVQTKIKYDPINITFHDDNSSLIRKMWHTYFTYNYKDATYTDQSETKAASQTGGASSPIINLNDRTVYKNNLEGQLDWGYIGEGQTPSQLTGIDNGTSKVPFFKAINIYGFNQHNFSLYRLINPVIESFSHDTYDYSNTNSGMEHQMTINYETVKYYEGALDGANPGSTVKGFGDVSHYDNTPSPIAQPGSNSTIMGQGGLVDAAGGIMNDLATGHWADAIQKAGVAAKTFKNPANIINIAKGEVLSGVTSDINGTATRNNLFSFPIDQASGAISAAKAKLNSGPSVGNGP